MKQQHINEIKGVIILAFGMILLASLVSFVPEDLSWYTSQPNIPSKNLINTLGAYVAGSLFFIFGYSAYVAVAFLFFWSWNEFASRNLKFSSAKFFGFFVFICVSGALLGMLGAQDTHSRFQMAGLVGLALADFLVSTVNRTGAYIILITLAVLSLIVTWEFLITPLIVAIFKNFRILFDGLQKNWEERKISLAEEPSKERKPRFIFPEAKPQIRENDLLEKTLKEKATLEKNNLIQKQESLKSPVVLSAAPKPKITIAVPEEASSKEEDLKDDYPKIVGEYHLPPLDLLEDAPVVPTSRLQQDLMSGAGLLEQTLANFDVQARVADIERGPVVTRYELEPAPGVKVQKFTALANDIALAMRAQTVRVVAPIPGKNRVGVEVPNAASAAVFLKDVLANSQFRMAASKLMLALGKDISGKALIADLADMPHLLIAGTTGSGKTVCVNGIIMSMIFHASPDEVKFVMVDPKMVELAQYADLPHLLCPPVTDVRKASSVLNWVVAEMEMRYKKLSRDGVRNIQGYNAKEKRMPYIVVIIDELADLMQVSAKTVESSITRLAQLSRAVGIHLILATQRPSVDVVTGVIKANFPARVSFKVASKVDSRTVLDMNGAESLLGKGDMLFLKPGEAKPIRGQCSFVKDEEIQKVIDFIKKQQKPIYDETILNQQKQEGAAADQGKDEFYDEALRLVLETNQASVSILQRRLRLGYTRAARLIDMMEQNGIVGAYCGSKPREILVDREQWLLNNIQKADEQNKGSQ